MTKMKMSAETTARKTKIRGRVAEGLKVNRNVNIFKSFLNFKNIKRLFPITMVMMLPAEEDGP